MTELKIVTWNIEWMNALFSNNKPKTDSDSKERLEQISSATTTLNPDILLVQEGPNEYGEMKSFVDEYLGGVYNSIRASKRDRHPETGRSYGDTQMVWVLYRNDRNLTHFEVRNSEYNGPFQDWNKIIDPNIGKEIFFHHRLPLEVDLSYDDGGVRIGPIKFFVLHAKSKKSSNSSGAIENRRKLLAQAINIRNWINYLLDMDIGRNIVICGDMNDGIGLDPFEYRLGGDFASIVTGSVRKPYKLFLNACEKEILENLKELGKHYTMKFGNEGPSERLVIDHILFSPSFQSGQITLIPQSGVIRNDILATFSKSSDHAPVEARILLS